MAKISTQRLSSWHPGRSQPTEVTKIREAIPLKPTTSPSVLVEMSKQLSDFILKHSLWKVEKDLAKLKQQLLSSLANTNKNSEDHKSLSKRVESIQQEQEDIKVLIKQTSNATTPYISMTQFHEEFAKYRVMYEDQASRCVTEVKELQQQVERLEDKIFALQHSNLRLSSPLLIGRENSPEPNPNTQQTQFGPETQLPAELGEALITPESSQVIPGTPDQKSKYPSSKSLKGGGKPEGAKARSPLKRQRSGLRDRKRPSKRRSSGKPVPDSVIALRGYVRRADEKWKREKPSSPEFVHGFLEGIAEAGIRAKLEKLLLERFPNDVKRLHRDFATILRGRGVVVKNIGWRQARTVLYRLKLNEWADG